MKASELRIGNYVLGPDGKVETISGVYMRNLVVTQQPCISFESTKKSYYLNGEQDIAVPIVITKQRLIQAGFKSLHIVDWYGTESKPKVKGRLLVNGLFEVLYGQTHIKMRYWHNLQNLYFALTGEELKATTDV